VFANPQEVAMNRACSAAATVAVMLVVSTTAWAKGQTARIEVRSDFLASPIQITDPSVVKSFNIWNGPGVRVNDEPVHMNPNQQSGAFVDWPRGEASDRPRALRRYEVSFHIEGRSPPNHRYVVLYEFDPNASDGYVPGRGDEWFRSNTFLILHGVEGRWFRSSSDWEQRVRPLLVKRSRPVR
jgi:hypothetical protein